MSDKFAFLTDEWIAAVETIVAGAAADVAAATTANLVVNLNVTDTPFGTDKQFHMGSIDGVALMGGGHKEPGDVTLTTDSLTFMLLACGRIDPEGPISDGRITWTGDDAVGAHAARNLAFTM